MARRVNTDVITFTWDVNLGLPQVLETSDEVQYVHGLDLIGEYRDGAWAYPLGDALGSVRQWTDESGFITYRGDYTPFGVALSSEGSTESAWGYTGEWEDASLGDLYLRARWMDVSTGRFTRRDPWSGSLWQPGSMQGYLYAAGNPMLFTDPTGNFVQCTLDGACYDDGYSISNPSFTSYNATERRSRLLLYNNSLALWSYNGWITDLEAFAELCNYAASMLPSDIEDRTGLYVSDLSAVLTELEGPTYYNHAVPLGQTGFDVVFQDPAAGGNQPHHFWAYMHYVFRYNSRFVATAGNLAHETVLVRPRRQNGQLVFVGRSYQDFALGQEAVNLGVDLYNGDIAIEGVGNCIQESLSPSGAAVNTWRGTIMGEAHQRLYAVLLAISSLVVPIPPGEQGGQ